MTTNVVIYPEEAGFDTRTISDFLYVFARKGDDELLNASQGHRHYDLRFVITETEHGDELDEALTLLEGTLTIQTARYGKERYLYFANNKEGIKSNVAEVHKIGLDGACDYCAGFISDILDNIYEDYKEDTDNDID